jgi:E3 ubiquitin-protein ligase listerin
MSKKFKSQASSARAASAAFGSNPFGSGTTANFQTSPLSYIAELPDLSGISKPNLVVTFKNLGKRDSTTKEKALEELQEYLAVPATSEAGIETGLLDAWVGLCCSPSPQTR